MNGCVGLIWDDNEQETLEKIGAEEEEEGGYWNLVNNFWNCSLQVFLLESFSFSSLTIND